MPKEDDDGTVYEGDEHPRPTQKGRVVRSQRQRKRIRRKARANQRTSKYELPVLDVTDVKDNNNINTSTTWSQIRSTVSDISSYEYDKNDTDDQKIIGKQENKKEKIGKQNKKDIYENKKGNTGEHNTILHHNCLIGDRSLTSGISTLRSLTLDKNIFLADADVSCYCLHFNYGWQNVWQYFHTEAWIPGHCGLTVIPTFTGDSTFGHWHTTIIDVMPDGTRGYVIDSLGFDRNRFRSSQELGKKLFPEIEGWKFIPTMRQDEMECGARVFLHICDIAYEYDMEKECFEDYAKKFDRMRPNEYGFASQIRELLFSHAAIADQVYNEQQYFGDTMTTRGNDWTSDRDQGRLNDDEIRTSMNAKTISVPTTTANQRISPRQERAGENGNENNFETKRGGEENTKNNKDKNGTQVDIKNVLCHVQDKKLMYYVVQIMGEFDSDGYVIQSNRIKQLTKSSQRILSKYKGRRRSKNERIISTMDKTTIKLDYSLCDEDKGWDTTFFLVKTGNGVNTDIVWRHSSSVGKGQIRNFNTWKKSTPLRSPTNNNNKTTHDDNADWGHSLGTKRQGDVRIVMENIDNLGISAETNPKQDAAKEWFTKNDADIVCWLEVGIAWHRVKFRSQLVNRLKCEQWQNPRVITANNKHEHVGLQQYGGTATMSFGPTSGVVQTCGSDPTGLGRWSWMQLTGRHGSSTVIISAYNPCKSKIHRPKTVYSQQKRYWLQQKIDTCPREMLRRDLSSFIEKYTDKGCDIVLCMDLNEDTTRENGPMYQTMIHTNGLVDVLKNVHGNDTPPTFENGTKTIDAIMVSKALLSVSRTGWLRFGTGVGDHRIAYVDIDAKLLFNRDKKDIVSRHARRLQIGNEKCVQRYNALVEKVFLQQRFIPRLNKLRRQTGGPITREMVKEIESLDSERVRIAKHAEKKCRKLKMGYVHFAPTTVQIYGKRIRLWSMILKKKSGRKVSSQLIKRKARSCGIKNYKSKSPKEVKSLRAEAWKKYKKAKKNSKEERARFLRERISHHDVNGNVEASIAVVRISKNEQRREAHKEIRQILKPRSSSTITHIEIDDDDEPGKVKIITQREEMESEMIKEFKQKYMEVYDTPLVHEPFRSLLGMDGLATGADEILTGKRKLWPCIHPDIIEFMEHMKIDNKVTDNPPINTHTSHKSFCEFWKPNREKISSSRSTVHNGHYIAAKRHPIVGLATAMLSSIPWEMGYALLRWLTSLTAALEKKPGVRHIKKVRTIQLLEADYNTGCKHLFANRAMSNAQKCGQIPETQYAKRNSRVVDGVILKRLFFDLCRIFRWPAAALNLDARGCYDRLALPIGSMALRRVGVPKRALRTLLQALMRMKHFVRTGQGDSEKCFSGTEEEPLQGGGQGNAAAGPMWTMISIVILSIVETFWVKSTFMCAMSLLSISLTAIMFVDDTDLFLNAEPETSFKEIGQRAQLLVDKWCSTLWLTGGCLRPEKCTWYLISFVWDEEGNWRYGKINETPYDLTIPDDRQCPHVIDRVEHNMGIKGLGVYLEPDGSGRKQFEVMRETSAKWARDLKHKVISRFTASIALDTTIKASHRFRVPALCLSQKQTEKIMQPVFSTIISKIGVVKSIANEYRYGPISMQGLGMPNLFTMQGIEHLKIVLQHGGQNTRIGLYMTCMMEGHQIECGSLKNIFELNYNKYECLITDSLVKDIWKYCDANGITIKTNTMIPQVQRQHDAGIMDIIIASRQFDRKDIIDMNKCRKYLQVITISDIATGCGRYISPAYRGRCPKRPRNSKWTWPYQPVPSNRLWKLWINAVTTTLCNDNYRTLETPLTGWKHQSHQNFAYYIDLKTNKLYTKVRSVWTAYTPLQTGRRWVRTYNKQNSTNEQPIDVVPTTIMDSNSNTIFAYAPTPYQEHRPVTDDTYILSNAPEYIQNMLLTTAIPAECKDIVRAIRNKTAICVTDGSYDPFSKYATACWILEGTDGMPRCKGAGQAYGNRKNNDPYRAELYGIYCSLLLVKYICHHYRIKEGAVTIVCDCKGALDKSLGHTIAHTVSSPNFDLLQSIYALENELPIMVEGLHVYGHQDERGRVLTRLEKLNCEVDKGAKAYLAHCRQIQQKPVGQPYGPQWCLLMDNEYITRDIDQTIIEHVHGKKLKDFLIRKGRLTRTSFEYVDWDALRKTNNKLSYSERTWLAKHVSRFAATGRNMFRRKEWSNSRCPLCGTMNEDSNHIVNCRATSASNQLESSVIIFKEKLTKMDTHPLIMEVFLLVLMGGDDALFSPMLTLDSEFTQDYTQKLIATASLEQDEIGRNNFVEGKISKKWAIAQERYYRLNKKQHRTGSRWAETVIGCLYDILRDMWRNRNTVLHDNNTTTESRKRKEKLRHDIRREFEKGKTDLRPADKEYLDIDRNKVEKWNAATQQLWLNGLKTLRRLNPSNRTVRKSSGKVIVTTTRVTKHKVQTKITKHMARSANSH